MALCTSADGSRGKHASTSNSTSGNHLVNGVNLYYERRGSGGHVVLLIPGALGCVGTFLSPQIEYFGRDNSNFTVIGFDPRGYGKSRPFRRKYLTDPLFYETDAHDAVGLMRGLGYERFSLLGWCDGGVSAILAAAHYPDYISKLVIWGSKAYISEEDIRLVEQLRDISNWNPQIREGMMAVYGSELPTSWSNWMDGFLGVFYDKQRRGDLCTKEVKAVKCPSLFLYGEKDALIPQFHAEYLSRELPNCRYVTFPDGKHTVHLKYHSEFNKLVEDFLNEAVV